MRFTANPFSLSLAITFCLSASVTLIFASGGHMVPDPFETIAQDTIPPFTERFGNFADDDTDHPFDLQDPALVERDIEYDPVTGQYIITERIGDEYYRMPTTMTFDEYLEWSAEKEQDDYWKQLAGVSTGGRSSSGKVDPISTVDISKDIIDRLFGGSEVDIRPQGNVDLTFGADFYRQDNPTLLERQRRRGGFDFDMDIQVNVDGKIGEKLSTSFNYNTKSTFDFENKLKLNYDSQKFSDDAILQKIEAGDVSLPLRGSLIQGSQSLFGIKTELQFGHLRLTAIASQQRSEKNDLVIQGGSLLQEFEVPIDQYVENRHFFLSHFNRESFDMALANLPQINSLFTITRMEVWVTNDKNQTTDVRDVVAIADLGESRRISEGNEHFVSMDTADLKDICMFNVLPANMVNTILDQLKLNPENRFIENVNSSMNALNLRSTRDYEKIRARRLSPSEYTYHPELGFISLNTRLQSDHVVGVAYEYTYNGEQFQVGEFSDIIPVDAENPSVIYVKMLKSTTQRIDLPIWDLMMKNFYRVGGGDVNPEEFQLDVFYEDPGAGFKRFLPAETGGGSTGVGNTPLITLLNLDNLNVTGDPQPDGRFDFVPRLTIYPREGLMMFPVLEPFGSSLENILRAAGTPESFIDSVIYPHLYDSTLIRAQEFPEFNRFTIKGKSQSSSSSDISLGTFNIPRGSVQVYAGGQRLQENVDYVIDYNIGRLSILNASYVQPGTPIRVSFEDNALFSFQKKTMLGLRADYEVNKYMNIGATYMHLFERPYTEKVNIGDDPINNRVMGLDLTYSKEAPWITKLVDKLPVINTKEPSMLNFQAEVAALKPGHSRAINGGSDEKEGVVYIDDFEGTASEFDLRTPETRWQLASVPQNAVIDNMPRFPESQLHNSLTSGANRAHFNWYRVDRSVRTTTGDNPYTRAINQQEIFRGRQQRFGNNDFRTFDINYIPDERGQYNFDPPQGIPGYSDGINADCRLNSPAMRWGGIQRDIPNTDFEQSNYEALEFWMLDPYILDPDQLGGEGYLVINLGNISEDILKDGRLAYEHGLPNDTARGQTDTTAWGRVPRVQPVVNAFSIDVDTRIAQDVGLDGLNDDAERTFYSDYINAIQNSFLSQSCKNEIIQDPSNDNFVYFRDPIYDQQGAGIIERYSRFNGTERNSPPTPPDNNLISANTNRPNSEDLNDDLSLSDGDEAYYQYVVHMERGTDGRPVFTSMGKAGAEVNWQLDSITSDVSGDTWYRFKIPLNDGLPVNGIQGFRSIRFMRMYMTGFEQQTILRFATLDLVRSQWRRYTRTTDPQCPVEDVSFAVDAVNVEEHDSKAPFPYRLPEGIRRERIIGSTFQDIFQNEQSLALQFCGLGDGCDVRIYKTLNLDMRVFEQLEMFVHAESNEKLDPGNPIENGDLSVFIRLGSDFENNYYEYELPLAVSDNPFASDLAEEIWKPDSNNVKFTFKELTDLKIERNSAMVSFGEEYVQEVMMDGQRYTLKIKGNPTLGYVKNVMIGIRNLKDGNISPLCGEVWVNELRVSGLDERGGFASLARVDMDLADFGTFGASATYSSIGYGAIDQKLDQRAKESTFQFDISTGLELGQFFGKEAGIRVPFYAQYSTTIQTPRFDPIDLDLDLKEKLSRQTDPAVRDSIKNQAEDYQALRVINFTNVKKERTAEGPPMPWSISNFSVSYAYSKSEAHNEIVSKDDLEQHKGQLDYNYSLPNISLQPFKGLSKSKWLKPVTELNLNPLPNSFSFNTVLDRRFGERDYRFSDEIFKTWFDKRYTWDRNYNVRWDLTKSIKIDFNATNTSVIDEPDEYIDRSQLLRRPISERRDSVWQNLKKFGRTKDYLHNARASYKIPTNHFPFLDWIRADVSYEAQYAWNAASINTDSLGNIIRNGQTRKLTADMDFTRLYSKSKYLGKINNRAGTSAPKQQDPRTRQPPAKKDADAPDTKDDAKDADKKDKKADKVKSNGQPGTMARVLLRPLMTVRRLRVNYSQEFTTVIPGFTPKAGILGMRDFSAPGWGFIGGLQPEIGRFEDSSGDWLDENGFAGRDWITDNAFQNLPVLQSERETLDGKLTLEPFRDFKIEVDAKRTVSNNFSIFYKDVTKLEGDNEFKRRSPREIGSFSMSYFTLPTLFGDSENELRRLFNTFENYRTDISQQRGDPGTEHPIDGPNYTEGFGSDQRDVIIPAFIAAYTGKEPDNFDIDDMFSWLPRPNWQLTYSGLEKLGPFKDIFSSVRISHGYKSTLTINSFETDLNFTPPQKNDDNINDATQNYYSRFIIPAVGIEEQFSPLIGIDIRTKSDMNFQVEFSKRRGLQLGFISSELAENRVTSVQVGMDYVLKNVELKFLPGFKASRDEKAPPSRGGNQSSRGGSASSLKGNDLELLFDFSFTDNITVNHYLDLNIQPQPTRGQKEISISPAIRYNLNRNINLRLFFDYRKTTPYTTTGYPITTTEGGITVQVILE